MVSVGVARPCPPFTLGFDCLAPVSAATARRARAAGYRFAGRYLDGPSPLTAKERDNLFAADLGILPLTVAVTGTPLNAALGNQRGSAAIRQSTTLGTPPGVHLTVDYESPAAGSDAQGDINAFAHAVVGAGYGCMLYVGVPEDLDGPELYALAPNRYFKGGGKVPEPGCGWCVVQCEPLDQTMFEGQRVDVDLVKEDYLGRLPTLWWPN